MNRIYRLVWNRALRVLQVASEFARSHGGGNTGGADTTPPRRRPLALALTVALAAAWSMAPPQASAQARVGGQGGAGEIADGTGDGGASGYGGSGAPGSSNPPTNGQGGIGGGAGGGAGGVVGVTYSTNVNAAAPIQGGNGGAGTTSNSFGDGGGGGGTGAYLLNSLVFTLNSGVSVHGGNGGSGNSDTFGPSGGGGGGGDGIAVADGSGSGATINNFGGTISGGNGGAGGVGATDGGGGGGGSGIVGAGIEVINLAFGTISGGRGGAGGSNGNDGANGDAIMFTGGSNTLTLGAGSTLNGAVEVVGGAIATLTADADGLDLSGGTLGRRALIVNGDTTIQTNGHAFMVSGDISGSGTLSKSGTGTLTLGGTNTYTGGTTIDAGTLSIASDSNLGNSTGGLTLNGGTLTNTAALTSGRAISLLGTSANTLNTNANLTLTGAIGGSGALTKDGTGTLTLSGTNTYTGGTTINAGTLSIASDTNLGASGVLVLSSGRLTNTAAFSTARTINLITAGTLDTEANLTLTGLISGNGTLTKTGAGMLTLSGANTYVGGTIISGGTLGVSSNANLGGSAGLSLDGGTLALIGAFTSSRAITVTGNNGVLSADSTATLSGNISGNGQLTVRGGGLLTYTGTSKVVPWRVDQDSALQVGDGGHIVGDSGFDGAHGVNGANASPGTPDGGIGGIGAPGGTGAQAVFLQTAGASLDLTDTGAISGGAGGAGGNGGAGGAGGIAGNSGAAGNGGVGGDGGNGGMGNTGVVIDSYSLDPAGGDIRLSNAGTISGGAGGAGGNGGAGANGGSGGNSGASGNSGAGGNGGNGGNGNTGIVISGAGTWLSNTGTISGGAGGVGGSGGAAGTGGAAGAAGQAGDGGVGVVAAGDATVINAGTIKGGNGNAQANAMSLSGGGNTLVLQDGYSFTGNVVSAGNDTLALGGDTSPAAAFDLGQIVATTPASWTGAVRYYGFSRFAKTGNSTWVVTGSTGTDASPTGSWTIDGGSLLVGDSASGHAGAITTNTFTNNGNVVVDGTGSSVTATAGITPIMIGAGGAGTLTVQNGGLVHSNSEMNIGQNAGDIGTVTVTGSNSVLSTARSINVGKSGIGTLVVSDGGTVSDGEYFSIADQAGSAALGSVTVTGAGSSITTQTAAVGNHGGTGTLTLADGGSFTSSLGFYIAQDADATGTVNIGAAVGDTATAAGTLNVTQVNFGAGTGTLVFNHTGTGLAFAPTITGAGTVQQLAGTTLLTADNTYIGTTTIRGGTLQVGNGGVAGSLGMGDVIDDGALVFDRSDDVAIGATISGSGALAQAGSGRLQLYSDSSGFTGSTTVQAGTLVVGTAAGTSAALGGNVNVQNNATLGGHGRIGGDVTVQSGGHLAPGNSIGTLTVDGDFSAAQGSVLDVELGPPGPDMLTAGYGDSIHVGGNLQLDGATLHVSDAGGMGPGLYNIFAWGGTLAETHGGLVLGTTPAGATMQLQHLLGQKQINLLNITGLTLNAWNANGQASATQMGGGSGTWSTTSTNWTDAAGTVPGVVMTPQPAFALFGGAAGTVTVDNSSGAVSATGLQFAVDGYTLDGDTLTLVGNGGDAPVIRVGDGSSAGAAMTATIANVLAGSDGLTKTDEGTLVLTGANTYTGTTTISAGTLALAGNGSIGASSSIVDNGTLDLSGLADDVAFSSLTGNGTLHLGTGVLTLSAASGDFTGTISGGGGLTLAGGSLTLAGTNSYTGTTTISGGTLTASAASLPGAVTNNAALVFAQNDNGSFSGAISGNGSIAKTGAGSLILNGDSQAYTGTTTVQAGTLLVGDAATPSARLGGDVTVGANGTLRGHGSIGGNVSNGGTVWAGGSVGTLTVDGDYTQDTSGTLQVEIDAEGHANVLAVGGKASLAGGALALADAPDTLVPGSTYTILTAKGGVSGTFATLDSNFAFLDPSLAYAPNAVTLSLQRNTVAFPLVGQTPNQIAAATAIEALGAGNAVHDAVLMLDAPTARQAFTQLAGDLHASARTAIMDDEHYVRDAVHQHLAGEDSRARTATDAHGITAWTAAWGHWGSHDSDGNASPLHHNGSGLLLGVDLSAGDTARLGAVMGTGQSSMRIDTQGTSAHVTNQHLGLYGDAQTGRMQWQGAAIYGWQKVDTRRSLDFGTFAGTATGAYRAHTVQAYVDGSVPFTLGKATLAPFVNLAVQRLDTPAIDEHGTPAALHVAGQDSSVGYGTLGLRASIDLGAPEHGLRAHASLGWQHAWSDVSPATTMRFAGGDSFAIAGVPVRRDAAATNLGIRFALAPSVSVDASYQGQFGKEARDQSARLNLDWRF